MSIEEIIRSLEKHALILDSIDPVGKTGMPRVIREVIALLRSHPEAQPNEPLTLEELREMDGEPVWVEMFVKGLKSHWAIVHGEYLTDGRFAEDKQRCLLSIDKNGGHGLAFRAYRRKPEEGV